MDESYAEDYFDLTGNWRNALEIEEERTEERVTAELETAAVGRKNDWMGFDRPFG
jgi:hypothetical protein